MRTVLLLFLLTLLNLDARHYSFKIGNSQVASYLSQNHEGAAVFLSYDLLEDLISTQLRLNGFSPRPGEPFVEFLGKNDPSKMYQIVIRGDTDQTVGKFKLTLHLNGKFYKESLNTDEIVIDAEVGLHNPPRNFAEALLGVISTPINLVMATVISVVFPFINEKLGAENDYINASVNGKYNPMAPLITIAKKIADFFLGWFGMSTGPQTYPVALKFVPQKHLMTIFNTLKVFEVGSYTLQTSAGPVRGVRVQFR